MIFAMAGSSLEGEEYSTATRGHKFAGGLLWLGSHFAGYRAPARAIVGSATGGLTVMV
jgi:hypothetical protein